jgi:hypothetical protein
MTQLESPSLSPLNDLDMLAHTGDTQHPTDLTFSEYRTLCDKYSGIMRIGIDDPHVYEQVGNDVDRIHGIPVAATNQALDYPFNQDVIPGDRKLAIMPEELVDAIGANKDGLAIYKQTPLSKELVEQILTVPGNETLEAIQEELIADLLGTGKQLVEGGLPEYMVFTKYDTSGCEELKKASPEDITLENGSIITTSREKILAKLPELIALHESVFSEQAMQIGYYGGLHKDGIEDLVNNPDFIPIAGFDGETGEALMFTLFAPDLKDIDSLPWMNPQSISKVLDHDDSNKALAIPLVITSKANGLGMFSKTVALAGQETLHKTQADTLYVLCESSALSVLYTPKVINRTLTKIGLVHIDTTIEATYLAEQVTSESES